MRSTANCQPSLFWLSEFTNLCAAVASVFPLWKRRKPFFSSLYLLSSSYLLLFLISYIFGWMYYFIFFISFHIIVIVVIVVIYNYVIMYTICKCVRIKLNLLNEQLKTIGILANKGRNRSAPRDPSIKILSPPSIALINKLLNCDWQFKISLLPIKFAKRALFQFNQIAYIINNIQFCVCVCVLLRANGLALITI